MANGLLNNLIGYWGLDEAAGANNATDKHSGGLTLTQYNSPASDTGKVYSTARTANGATNNRHFRRTSETATQTGDVDFTLGAWVYPAVTNVSQVVVCKLGDLSEYIMYYDSAVSRWKFGVSVNGSDVYEVTASNFGAPSANAWYSVVGWHDSVNNLLGVSINNGTANTTAHTTGVYVSTNPFVVASGWDGANTFWQLNGRIGPVAMWKSAGGGGGVLTSDQRTALYNAGNGLAYASLDNGSDVIPALLRPRRHFIIDSWR